jgi:hypothetical protein
MRVMLQLPALVVARLVYLAGGMLQQLEGRYHMTSRALREAAAHAYFAPQTSSAAPQTSSAAPQTSSAAPQTSSAAARAPEAQDAAAVGGGGGGKGLRSGGGGVIGGRCIERSAGRVCVCAGEVWARMTLVSYLYENKEKRHSLERVAGEVPHQLLHLGSWQLLCDVVCSMPVFFAYADVC